MYAINSHEIDSDYDIKMAVLIDKRIKIRNTNRLYKHTAGNDFESKGNKKLFLFGNRGFEYCVHPNKCKQLRK